MPKFNATEYANEYISKNYDRLSLAIPGGMKSEFQNHVNEHKEKYKSITDFLIKSAKAQIEIDNESSKLEIKPVEEIPEQETQSATLTPSFRVDSMDYPTGMLDSPSIDELRKRRDAIADKRNAAKERRDAFRAEMSQKEEQPMNNIGELFAQLGAEQISKEQSEGEPQNS